MISVFIGDLILAWGKGGARLPAVGKRRGKINAEAAESAKFAEERGDGNSNFRTGSGLDRKSVRFALTLNRHCTRGQFYRGTLLEFGVKDKEGRLRIIRYKAKEVEGERRKPFGQEIVRKCHVTA